MTILSWPNAALVPSSMRFGLSANTMSGGVSPWDQTEQTIELPGARWQFELTFEGLDQDEGRMLNVFLARLGGRAGRFTWSPTGFTRRGVATGAPVINGGSQSGISLLTRGWGSGEVGKAAFRRGDWISYQDYTGRHQLHLVTDDCFVASGGTCAIPIAPQMRRAGADGASLEFVAPKGVFRLTDDYVPLDLAGEQTTVGGTFTIQETFF